MDAARGQPLGSARVPVDDVERSLDVKKKTDAYLRGGPTRSRSCTRDRSRCDANVPVMNARESTSREGTGSPVCVEKRSSTDAGDARTNGSHRQFGGYALSTSIISTGTILPALEPPQVWWRSARVRTGEGLVVAEWVPSTPERPWRQEPGPAGRTGVVRRSRARRTGDQDAPDGDPRGRR